MNYKPTYQRKTNPYSTNQPSNQFRKLWIYGQKRKLHGVQQGLNSMVENQFMHLLQQAKHLLAKDHPVVFEKDQRNDGAHSATSMHSFASPTLYLYLECDYQYHFRVEYAFRNCPCEAELRTLLKVYPLNERAKQVALEPDFTTFYKRVLDFQDKAFIYSL